MYKKFYILATILITFTLFSCATTGKTDKTNHTEPKIIPQKNNSKPSVKTLKESKNYLETNIEYPVFEDKKLLNTAIENSILSYYNEFAKAAQNDWQESFGVVAEGEEASPFSYSTTFNYSFSKKYTSVLIETEMYSGGAHGTKMLNSYNYDEINHVLQQNICEASGYTYDEISQACRKHLYKKFAQNLDKEWIDSGTEPLPYNFEIFTIDDNSITVYFEPYTVAPYSMGVQNVKINLIK